MGLLAAAVGDITQARTLHEQALALFRDLRNRAGIAAALYHLAAVAHAQGRADAATRLARGAAFGAVAGAFLLFMLIYLLEGLAWLVNDLLNVTSGVWIGFFIVTIGLLGFGALCAALSQWM